MLFVCGIFLIFFNFIFLVAYFVSLFIFVHGLFWGFFGGLQVGGLWRVFLVKQQKDVCNN